MTMRVCASSSARQVGMFHYLDRHLNPRSISKLLAGFAFTLGGITLFWPSLVDSDPAALALVMPNSALALCLLGSALLLGTAPQHFLRHALASIAFAIVALLAALTLAEYALHFNWSIDALVSQRPARIAPLAAWCFLLLALAGLLGSQRRWQIWLFSFSTTFATFLALLTLMGHLFKVQPFSGSGTSPLTALGLLALAASMIFARPRVKLTEIFFSDTTGGLMARRLLPATILLPLLIGFLVQLGEASGLYSEASGLSVAALIFLVSFTALVAWSAHSIHRVDQALQSARREVEQLNLSLEQKVALRTQDLQRSNLKLQNEIAERLSIEQEVIRYRDHLEELVSQRTHMVEQANLQLLDEIARRKQIERKLSEQKERAQVTLASIGDAVITTDARGTVVYLNPVAENLTGWRSQEAKSKPITEIMRLLNEVTREAVENPALACLRKDARAVSNNANLLLRRDGTEIPVSDSAAPIRDREHTIVGAVLVLHDVTKERQLTQQLSYQASHDGLTGLVNRPEFERRVARVLESAKQDGSEHVLLFLDLDHFKQVNDTSGHAAGDELLRQIALLLKRSLRQRDTLARLGGDEFGLLLERCSMSQAESVATTLLSAMNTFIFDWEGRQHRIGLSIGMVTIDRDSGNLSTVLNAADAACYDSKHSGRNRYSISPQTMRH